MTIPPIAELLPQSAPMILLDRVLEASENRLLSEVTIRADALFCDGSKVGAWVGIEYMAQTIAAMVGWRAKLRGEPVRAGFLLGTRHYSSAVSEFNVGDCLQIEVEREIEALTGISAVNCRISYPDGRQIANAMLTVFQPDNLQEFLNKNE